MKSINISIILLLLLLENLAVQQSIYVRKVGLVDYQTTINSIDSMKISASNIFDIYKGGSAVYQTPLASTDSITFFPPNKADTYMFRLNTCDWNFQYIDNFDGATCNSGTDYGLNNNMLARQTYNPDLIDLTWIRKSDSLSTGVTPIATYAQVNRSIAPKVLTIISTAGNTAALMLNKLIITDTSGRYHVNFTTDPILFDKASDSWISFMLDSSNAKDGYVSLAQFGFLISSNGAVQVNHHNTLI